MINYLSKINYLSIKLITCQNKLIADQKLIDYICQNSPNTATIVGGAESQYVSPLTYCHLTPPTTVSL